MDFLSTLGGITTSDIGGDVSYDVFDSRLAAEGERTRGEEKRRDVTRAHEKSRRKKGGRARPSASHRRNVIGSVVFATGAADLFMAEYAPDPVCALFDPSPSLPFPFAVRPFAPSFILFLLGFLYPRFSLSLFLSPSPARLLAHP